MQEKWFKNWCMSVPGILTISLVVLALLGCWNETTLLLGANVYALLILPSIAFTDKMDRTQAGILWIGSFTLFFLIGVINLGFSASLVEIVFAYIFCGLFVSFGKGFVDQALMGKEA